MKKIFLLITLLVITASTLIMSGCGSQSGNNAASSNNDPYVGSYYARIEQAQGSNPILQEIKITKENNKYNLEARTWRHENVKRGQKYAFVIKPETIFKDTINPKDNKFQANTQYSGTTTYELKDNVLTGQNIESPFNLTTGYKKDKTIAKSFMDELRKDTEPRVKNPKEADFIKNADIDYSEFESTLK